MIINRRNNETTFRGPSKSEGREGGLQLVVMEVFSSS